MSGVVTPEASAIHWSALFSWSIAIACAVIALGKQRRVRALAPPPTPQLLRELGVERAPAELAELDELDEVTRRLAIAELNQRLGDVSFELGVMPSTFAALIRIVLASGSGLALVGFLTATDLPVMLRALRLAAAASAGLVGALVIGIIGRLAKDNAREIRESWDGSSRDFGKALGTSLAAAESRESSR